ncbi:MULTISPECIES: carboxypeptidase-like regulatory domain-containing protein [Aestuariibaculum]|uniref:Carboxypeptidase-like regulatory domain-containing protein n=1 Tax=Aestuariibaculum lutulentum TaxID=2920935 RepID=A0ABS9RHT6_9FLAO|nr:MULTISPECIES: carboxypeptidase-like regulatory domain-containing protein [Aestuariibaculum]MCH4552503.1 carboxypeptidase-like regulatory domain-containing protein [Aestuariibaculum lutulentum]MCR8668619.1 carboxypeptidase-like regulatory domain-containing protein [Aestuariibaculum sp. M13]
MKNYLLLFFLLVFSTVSIAQEAEKALGVVVNSSDGKPLENVNIVNLNQVIGTATNKQGEFEINAKPNDTLHLSYLGFKSIKVRVTNDWLRFGSATIELTELALALEEVVVNQLKLTGYLEVDVKQVPVINDNYRYQISGLPSTGYEANSAGTLSKIVGSIFNPADFLHRVFGKKPNEMRKLKKMKQDDEIRNLLASRFDREMLTALLNIDRVDLDEIVSQCNYSKEFIQTANDLQILDAISECYEEYKLLNRER